MLQAFCSAVLKEREREGKAVEEGRWSHVKASLKVRSGSNPGNNISI